MKKIYFSHGKESGPNGRKIQRLSVIGQQNGYETQSIDYTHLDNPDARVAHFLKILEGEKSGDEIIFVGSSMGGYVSVVAGTYIKPAGIFILAPALFIEGYKVQDFGPLQNVEIVHGWDDDIIPYTHSIQFAQQQKCTLHLVKDGHRLMDSMDTIDMLFDAFLKQTDSH